MPMPFRPISIPLNQGLRQDLTEMDTDNPSQLEVANNVAYHREGSIVPRLGMRSRDGLVQMAASAPTGDLETQATGALIPAGIVASKHPSVYGDECPLLLYQGLAMASRDTWWQYVGQPWSARLTRSPVLTSQLDFGGRLNPIPCGPKLIGADSTVGATAGFLFVNNDGSTIGLANNALINSTARTNWTCAGNMLAYANAGTLYAEVPGTIPAVTHVTLSTGVKAFVSSEQGVAGCLGETGAHYFAFVSSTVGRITLLRVNTSGTVTASFNYSPGGTIKGVAICHDGTDKLCLAYINTTGSSFHSNVFTTATSSFTDTGLTISHAGGAQTASGAMGLTAGTGHQPYAVLTWVGSTNNLELACRQFSSATLMGIGTLYSAGGSEWLPAWGAVGMTSRTLIGLYRTNNPPPVSVADRFGQWVVLDVTEVMFSGVGSPSLRWIPVASGETDGCWASFPSNASVNGTTEVMFGVAEGITFTGDFQNIESAGVRKIVLTAQGMPAASCQGLTLLGNSVVTAYDGTQMKALNFVEGYPIVSTPTPVAGGSLTTTSDYSFQAIWETTNAQGHIIRSAVSPLVTGSTTGVNLTLDVTVTVPQLLINYGGSNQVSVKLYMTEPSAVAGAPLYLLDTQVMSTVPSSGTLAFSATSDISTDSEQIYALGATLSDERPPAGDRGIAYAGDRLWVADQDTVFASKILRAGIGPAFSTVGLHTIAAPRQLGQIQGIAGLDDKLVVVCATGVFVVWGPGLDDNGAGPGWSTQIISPHGAGGSSSPRSVCSTSEGVVFVGREGDAWLVSRGLDVVPLSRPARMTAGAANVDVAFVTSRYAAPSTQNPLIVLGAPFELAGSYRVLDAERGLWATWNSYTHFPAFFIAGINGILWGQYQNEPVSYDQTNGTDGAQDTTVSIRSTIETGLIKPAESNEGWGRLRGITIHEAVAEYDLEVFVELDNGAVAINSGYSRVAGGNPTWPYQFTSEFRTTTQRCSFFKVNLVADGRMEWNSIEAWVSASNESAPKIARS